MASNNDHPGTNPNDVLPGLEGHLRSLILTNASGAPTSNKSQASNIPTHTSDATGPPLQSSPLTRGPTDPTSSTRPANSNNWTAQDSPVSHEGQIDSTGHRGPPSPRGNRRRPNQAQRRQMNSQFSIPIDPRQQQPDYSPKPNFMPTGNAFHSRHPPAYQRHQHTNSHPHAMSQTGRADLPHSHGSWSGPMPNQAANGRGHSHASPRGHHASVDFHHGPPNASPHFARQGPGMVSSQRRPYYRPEEVENQADVLNRLCYEVVSSSEIERSEIADKESFRQRIENISRDAIARFEQEQGALQGFSPLSVELKCFGSLSSGFATKASDMDLGLLSPLSSVQPDAAGSPIPRLVEKAFLDAGLGARLLSRTRVPIIKLCESPPESLRQGLLAQREKWEAGDDNDPHDDLDEDHHENDFAPKNAGDGHANAAPTENVSAAAAEFEIPCGSDGEMRRFHLRQGSKHTLSAYYGLAKRVLRKAGGRDVTASNYRDFTEADWTILNMVGEAFVRGLADPDLQQRLAKYPTISLEPRYNLQNNRSLVGIFTQIEGENVLQSWEAWPAREFIMGPQPHIEQGLRAWDDVQRKMSFGADPVMYSKELQLALERIKRIPWFQVLVLEQGQNETPSQYHMKTRGILNFLKVAPEHLPILTGQIIPERYIGGIYQHDIRDALEATIQQLPGQLDFEAIGRRHKSLHLAADLERAIGKGLYDTDTVVGDIRLYISLLRLSPAESQQAEASYDCVVRVPPELASVLATIRTLKDPHKMAPNQPRDKYRDPLEFPKTGAGVQCDINFSAHLALQNTLLLRCYSHTDPRVRPMVLFIKHWAKVRGINSGYRGTLSSYGYVLMVLHYLVNVAQPFVCPNLQQLAPQPPPNPSAGEMEATVQCKGYNVQFWRNESEILQLAHGNQLNHSSESIGHLLRGFFEYFAQSGFMSNSSGKGFDWGRDVLSLRTPSGLLSKQEKGWTGAKTVFEVQGTGANQSLARPQGSQPGAGDNSSPVKPAQAASKGEEVKEVRYRYLFAVEDPFELNHNVARTVTHNGIVSIRDEFRRAWRLIRTTGSGEMQENLLQDVNEMEESLSPFLQLLDDIHGTTELGKAQ